ncbi:MAG: cardiolipin synthase, partial [Erysipelotrichaceae bacterium]|nr:cardiolipin synthase [Erysipelotrichaceae bacterium]
SDDRVATVGTANLDYRSLYLHFENGTYICGSKKIKQIKKDFTDTLAVSKEISPDDIKGGPVRAFFLSVVRLLAPLM